MQRFVFSGLVLLVAVVGTPRTASASLLFPDVVQDYCDLPVAPDCTLCHTISPGTESTATKPFADMVRAYETVGGDLESLRRALVEADEYAVDYDGDGVQDLDEVRQGTDPNDGNDPPPLPPVTDTETTNSTTGAGGADGDTGSLNSVGVTATTGPVRKPPPEKGVVPSEMRTGCSVAAGAPAATSFAGWLVVAALAGARRRLRCASTTSRPS